MKLAGVITIDIIDVHGKGQGQRSKVKVTEVMTPFSRFRNVTPVWIHILRWNDAYSLMLRRRGALLFFKVIRQISRSHGQHIRRIWPRLGVSGLYLQFQSINGYEMMHNAWRGIGQVPYCFSRSSVKLQGHVAKKSIFTQIGRFLTVIPVWTHQWLRNDAQTWSSIEKVLYCFSRSFVKLQGHTAKTNIDFDPNWAFPHCNSSLNSLMDFKWCTKLRVPYHFSGSSIKFQHHTGWKSTICRSYQIPQICLAA